MNKQKTTHLAELYDKKYIHIILNVLNSTSQFFKYPIGNKELTEKVKQLESLKKIQFNEYRNRWEIT